MCHHHHWCHHLPLSFQGKYADAESIFMQVLPTIYKVLGPDHPIASIFMNNIAASLREQVRSCLGGFVEGDEISLCGRNLELVYLASRLLDHYANFNPIVSKTES